MFKQEIESVDREWSTSGCEHHLQLNGIMNWSSACKAFLLGCMIASPLMAQEPSQYEVKLHKDFISWTWDGKLHWYAKTWNGSLFNIQDRFTSNLFRESGLAKKWKDENNLKISWLLLLSKRWQLRSYIQSRVFSDENSFVKFSKHIVAQEFIFRPHPQIQIAPALGWTVEDIFNHRDQGFYTRVGLQVSKFDMGGYLNDTDLSSVIRAIPGRKNQSHSFFTGWTKKFSEYASDSLRLGYQFSESRYYLQNSDDLERVIINARFLNNQLHYRISERSQLIILTELKNRDIDQTNPNLQNRREEFFLSNQFHYQLALGRLMTHLGILTSQTVNDNPGLETDIDALQTALTSAIRFSLTKRDVFWMRFSYTKYEYNTPDTLVNHDDRDEQRFILEGTYQHRFSPFFRFSLKGQVYLYHQIFIHATRSANNNWNRIFQVGAAFDHRLGNSIQHRNQIKILANYTIFDFESLLPRVRSFVFRKLVYSDSLSINLSRDLTFNSQYQLEKEDNGTFYQEQFAQQVTKELTAHFINLFLQYRTRMGLHFKTGISLHIRDEWAFLPEKRKVREYRSLTPRITLIYPTSKRLIFHATYAPNRSSNFGRNTQYYTTGNINLRYYF